MANTYEPGDRIILTGIFDADGVPTDPTAVLFKIISPLAVQSNVNANRKATGNWEVFFTIPLAANSAGVWKYRFEGSGAYIGVGESTFTVTATSFT